MNRLVGLLMLAAAGGVAPAAPGEVTVALIDGTTHTGKLLGLDAARATVQVAGRPVEAPARDLQEVRLAAAAPDVFARPGRTIVRTVRGGWLVVEKLTMADGRIAAWTALAGEAKLDLAAVADILLPDPKIPPRQILGRLGEMDLSDKAADHLVIRPASGRWMSVAGALRAIGPEKLTFRFDERDRTLDVAKARYVRLAAVGEAPRPPRGYVLATDGSRVAFETVAVADGTFRLTGTALGPLTLAPRSVAAILFRNDNVVHLGDLEPAGVVEAGTFGSVFRYRRDRSAAGKPLTLGGTVYRRGLGLHSQCELTYALDGAYQRLVGQAGIDDAARPGGNAVLTILGDGKPLLPATTLTGKDKPIALRLDLRGVRTLKIRVDFGADLDVADHVDLADVKLIK